MKNPFTSYLRHWLTLQLTKLFLKLELPTEGLDDAVAWLTEALVLLVIWAVTRYVLPFFNDKGFKESFSFLADDDGKMNAVGVMFVMGFALAAFSLSSCGTTGEVIYRDEESGAKGGLSFREEGPPLPFFRVPVGDGLIEVSGSK